MIIISTFSSGDTEETLIEFPVCENSKLLPRVSRSNSSSGYKLSYTSVVVSIGLLILKISAK